MDGQMDFLFFSSSSFFWDQKGDHWWQSIHLNNFCISEEKVEAELCGLSIHGSVPTSILVSKTKQENDENFLKQDGLNTSEQWGLSFAICNAALLLLQGFIQQGLVCEGVFALFTSKHLIKKSLGFSLLDVVCLSCFGLHSSQWYFHANIYSCKYILFVLERKTPGICDQMFPGCKNEFLNWDLNLQEVINWKHIT